MYVGWSVGRLLLLTRVQLTPGGTRPPSGRGGGKIASKTQKKERREENVAAAEGVLPLPGTSHPNAGAGPDSQKQQPAPTLSYATRETG